MKKDNLKGQHRINEQIRAKEVRIVGDNIEPTVVSIHEALRLAEENEADLVEIHRTQFRLFVELLITQSSCIS